MKVKVWAPRANSVDVVHDSGRHAMASTPDGNWEADVPVPDGGYRLSIDGGAPVPDPRSRWQRDGVHGASFAVDLDPPLPFNAPPLKEALIYELHIGTFTPEGTYTSAAAKLDHLRELGVTHVELLPIATFPGARGWGYDGVDLYAPLPAYGTPAELKGFVEACHRAGIAVLLDVVYNHLGPDGNYLGQFGPYFTPRYKTPWGEAINYDDSDSDAVRRYVIDNALMWLRDYGFDGLRLDAVHAIYCFEATHVLEQLATEVRALSETTQRSYVLIAESDLNEPRLVRPTMYGGYGLDAHWEDDFHHALHRYFTGESGGYYCDFGGLADLARALRDGYVYQGEYSKFRRRRHGRVPLGVLPEQIVVFAQNHDQVGNRATGERLSMLLEPAKLKAIAALVLLSPFVPMLFQGEEWGARTPFLYFTDHNEELGRLVSEGRTREFKAFEWQGEVPDPQAEDSFALSRLDWAELCTAPHADLLDWHRQLIRLRQEQQRAGSQTRPSISLDAAQDWLTYAYRGILVRFNMATEPRSVPMPPGAWQLALASQPVSESTLDLPPRTTLIYRETTSV